jgi:CBS domain-containing protein
MPQAGHTMNPTPSQALAAANPPDAAAKLTVADVMHGGVIFCERQATAREIADTMISRGVHSVAVLGHTLDAGHAPTVWGIVSDIDVLAALIDPSSTATGGDLAREQVIVIRSTRPIGEAAEAIATRRVNHLVVIDPDTQSPIGFISPLDIAQALVSDPA